MLSADSIRFLESPEVMEMTKYFYKFAFYQLYIL